MTTPIDSVDWLPPSVTDISLTKRDGFCWIKVYACSIFEDDNMMINSEVKEIKFQKKPIIGMAFTRKGLTEVYSGAKCQHVKGSLSPF